MKDKSYAVEMNLRIYDNENGQFLTVRPSADFPDGNVMVFAEKDQEEYFGSLRLDLPAPYMRQIANAILRVADDLEGVK